MRQKRAKAYKKQMVVYLHTFKFREPFQTIVDDELVTTCVNSSFELDKGLNRTVQGETKPMITQCCMQKLYDNKDQRAIDVAKTFERRRCHHREAIEPAKCIASIANVDGENKHRYIIATQNYELRKSLRRIPGIPLIYMNRSVMVMEPLSDASARYSEIFERKKLTKGLNDSKYGKEPKPKPVKRTIEEGAEEPAKKKKKGPKGPNPLSIKKKKDEKEKVEEKPEGAKKKRSRHKKSGESAKENNEGESSGDSSKVNDEAQSKTSGDSKANETQEQVIEKTEQNQPSENQDSTSEV